MNPRLFSKLKEDPKWDLAMRYPWYSFSVNVAIYSRRLSFIGSDNEGCDSMIDIGLDWILIVYYSLN
jgi:hypothetical protein